MMRVAASVWEYTLMYVEVEALFNDYV